MAHWWPFGNENMINRFQSLFQADDFTKFLADPDAPPEKPKAEEFGKFPGAEALITLTNDNFQAIIKEQDNLLVMFYAPCKQPKTQIPYPN